MLPFAMTSKKGRPSHSSDDHAEMVVLSPVGASKRTNKILAVTTFSAIHFSWVGWGGGAEINNGPKASA